MAIRSVGKYCGRRVDATGAGAVDSQFLALHGNFGFQPVNLGNVRFVLLNQEFPVRQHGDTHDPDNVQHRMLDICSPILRQQQ